MSFEKINTYSFEYRRVRMLRRQFDKMYFRFRTVLKNTPIPNVRTDMLTALIHFLF